MTATKPTIKVPPAPAAASNSNLSRFYSNVRTVLSGRPSDADKYGAPPFPSTDKRHAAGCIVRMPNGNVCLVEPRNHFPNNTWHTFPKGGTDPGESPSETACRETLEESGLQVKISNFVMHQDRSTSMTAYYVADAVGGSPDNFRPDETQATLQVPLRAAPYYLSNPRDHEVLWKILNSAKLSKKFMPDADTRDASGLTGREKLHRALLRMPSFWAPTPNVDPVHPEYVRPKQLGEHEVLTPRGGMHRATRQGTGNVTYLETQSLVDLLPHIGARSVVLFDFDQTLVEYRCNKSGWGFGPVTVEPYAAEFVNALQDCGVPVMGLTARHPMESDGVLEDLLQVGIDMTRTAPLPEGTKLPSQGPSTYRQGVIFAGDYNSKGEMLSLAQKAAPFTHAVMVDDNSKNFFSLSSAARKDRFDLTCSYYQPGIFAADLERQAPQWELIKQIAKSPKAIEEFDRHANKHQDIMRKKWEGVFDQFSEGE